MKRYKLDSFTRGWIVGDFEPSVIRSRDCEVSVRHYMAGDMEDLHVHNKADEVTVIISGTYQMNDIELSEGDVIHLEKGDPADFHCIRDGWTVAVKLPSVIGDKQLL